MANILVIGADGQLGKSLSNVCDSMEGLFYFTTRKDLDISNPESISKALALFKADYIINCAAYTAVDKAEEEEEKAFEINHNAVVNIIKESEHLKSKIIHISTDYVFNGNASFPYKESDEIDPQSVYGRSKAAGEIALIEQADDRSIIIRTSWLYSEFGHNFLKTMLRLGAEKEELNVVSDQIGVPTYAKDLANAILRIIDSNISFTSPNTILHFSNKGESNWFEFASEIMNMANLECNIHPIKTSAYPTPAKRPSFSILDSHKIENLLNFQIRPWKDALAECISTIKKN